MLRIIIHAIILLFGYNLGGNCNPIPNPEFASILNITNNINANTKSMEFNITLPNNEVLKVNLSFEFMRQPSTSAASAAAPPTTTIKTREWVELTTVSSTPPPPTTTVAPTSTATDEDNIKVTVDEVIELFQANLIEKENTECNSTILWALYSPI